MSYETFKKYMGSLRQVGEPITVSNPTSGAMKCRIQVGEDGGAVLVTLPPGSDFQFIIGTQNLTLHMDGLEPARQLTLAAKHKTSC